MTSNPPVRTAWLRIGRRLATLGALAIAVAGCSSGGGGGTGVASLGTGSGSGSAGSHPKASPLAYSRCMRAHGITKFPDPGDNGELRINAGPGTGIDPRSPQFKAAEQACKALLPTPPAADRKKNRDAMLKFSQCMRKHGVASFPDPDADGRLEIRAKRGDTSLDPNSSVFKNAQQACQHLMPGGKGGPGGAGTVSKP
jgi:hypothetical protein